MDVREFDLGSELVDLVEFFVRCGVPSPAASSGELRTLLQSSFRNGVLVDESGVIQGFARSAVNGSAQVAEIAPIHIAPDCTFAAARRQLMDFVSDGVPDGVAWRIGPTALIRP